MAFSRENPSPRYLALLAQYKKLHREGEKARGIPPEEKYKGISLPRHAGTIKELIDRHQAQTLLDYGSGKGKQYEEYAVKTSDGEQFPSIPAFWGVDSVTCYDPAVPQFSYLPSGQFDGVISTDVLEHIPEDDVDWIVAEMLDYARSFLFMNIASFAAKAHLPNGENAHCTIKSPEWWRERLAQLHAANSTVHLLALVVEMKRGGDKARLERIELLPQQAPSPDAHDTKEEQQSITLDLDDRLADQLERAFAPEASPSEVRKEAASLTQLGAGQMQQSDFKQAAENLQRAAALAPDDIEARCNLGTSLLQAGRREEAEEAFKDCLAKEPLHGRAKFNLASCRMEIGDLEAAFALLSDLIEAEPAESPHARDARWVRSLILLQMENFARGWQEYEHRWQSTRSAAKPQLDLPEYAGESLAGKRIMIYGEQGIGDEIMFASCMGPLLEEAEQATIVCSQRLESLFARSFPNTHISGMPAGGKLKASAGVGKFDYQLAAGSVAKFTRANRLDFRTAAPYLAADPQRVQHYRQALTELPGAIKVGVAWRGGRDAQDTRLRSMPLATWGPILRSRGVCFVDLQYDSTPDERRDIEERYGIKLHHFDDVDPRGSLAGQAALIEALDLVISVSNAAVHLAGGLGKQTWVLLPKCWGWRWHRQRETSLFYPSVTLLRQQREGDWATLATAIGEKLRNYAAQTLTTLPSRSSETKKVSGPKFLRLPDTPDTANSAWQGEAPAEPNV